MVAVYYLFCSHTYYWSQHSFFLFPPLVSPLHLNSCSVSECASASLFVSMCLCGTAPLSPLLCNCLGLGWQSRPDKRTQIVSGDGWKRSVCSLLYLYASITCVWRKQRRMMDGCPALSLSSPHSVHSVSLSLTHFSPLGFSSFSHHFLPPSFCNLSSCSLSLWPSFILSLFIWYHVYG